MIVENEANIYCICGNIALADQTGLSGRADAWSRWYRTVVCPTLPPFIGHRKYSCRRLFLSLVFRLLLFGAGVWEPGDQDQADLGVPVAGLGIKCCCP